MDIGEIISEVRNKICSSIEFIEEGVDRSLIITPFNFEDGDAYKIVLKDLEKGEPFLTDEGHTLMHLSYFDIEYDSGTRSRILFDILNRTGIENRDGELVYTIHDVNCIGDHLFTFIQCITNISDLDYLRRERVRSTFMEDMKNIIKEY